MNVESNNQLIPYLVLEEYFKKKHLEEFKKTDEFLNYISSYFGIEKKKIKIRVFYGTRRDNFTYGVEFEIPQKNNDFYKISFMDNGKIENELYVTEHFSSNHWRAVGRDIKSLKFEKSKKTREFFDYFLNRYKPSHTLRNRTLQTNNSDFILMTTYSEFEHISFGLYKFGLYNNYISYYYKTIEGSGETQEFGNDNQEGKKYTEEDIAKILISLKVDISSFSEEEKEEINQFYIASIGNLEKDKEAKIKEFREIQIERIMLAYQKFKEIAELLNETKTDLKFDKIKIDNLSTFIFKNNGNPTEKGYIEFDDFFKNNMILRMLDLSDLDLTNVNITYMDFSGTNIHINPQKIYNKDMSGVNALGVHFSPFTDSFDDVILDGALINDYEAIINLDRLRSYSDTTVIKKETVSVFSK